MDDITLRCGDCLEEIRCLPDKSVHLILTDPPYNIGKAEWDLIDHYIDWCIAWLKECERVLTDTGSLYLWHNDMTQIPELLTAISRETGFQFRQMCSWIKPNFRKMSWGAPTEKNKLRNWFNICEYCLYFIKSDGGPGETGLHRINSNPECYKPLKEWYAAEIKRLGLTKQDIAAKYTGVTGRKPHMVFKHYFNDSQFEIPTQDIWESVYEPLGFGQSYEELRQSYEELRQSYEELRPVHNLDNDHCNIWLSNQLTGNESTGKNHICEKPVDILERIIRTSTRPGETVLDLFMGSGSAGVACINTGRNFIGIEKDEKYFKITEQRIDEAIKARALAYTD